MRQEGELIVALMIIQKMAELFIKETTLRKKKPHSQSSYLDN